MTLFPKNTVFRKVIKTEDFTCNEMRDGKAWTYQVCRLQYIQSVKQLFNPVIRYFYFTDRFIWNGWYLLCIAHWRLYENR